MQRLVDDLLTLSALESEQNAPVESEFAVAPLLLELSADARSLSGRRHRIGVGDIDAAALVGIARRTRQRVRQPRVERGPLHAGRRRDHARVADGGGWHRRVHRHRQRHRHRARAPAAPDRALLPRRPQPLARDRRHRPRARRSSSTCCCATRRNWPSTASRAGAARSRCGCRRGGCVARRPRSRATARRLGPRRPPAATRCPTRRRLPADGLPVAERERKSAARAKGGDARGGGRGRRRAAVGSVVMDDRSPRLAKGWPGRASRGVWPKLPSRRRGVAAARRPAARSFPGAVRNKI